MPTLEKIINTVGKKRFQGPTRFYTAKGQPENKTTATHTEITKDFFEKQHSVRRGLKTRRLKRNIFEKQD